MKDSLREKRDTLERMLADEHVLVHVAPQAAGVQLPDHLRVNPTVTLKLSRYFRGSLTITDTQASAELLFGERYFTCVVPFAAMWGMTSMRGQFLMWPESAPAEVLASLEQQAQARRADALAAEAEGADAAADEGGKSSGATDAQRVTEKPTATPTKQRPQLRRIK